MMERKNGFRNNAGKKGGIPVLETSIRIYIQIEKHYNETLRKPIYLFPGLLMGFRKSENEPLRPFWSKNQRNKSKEEEVNEETHFEYNGRKYVSHAKSC